MSFADTSNVTSLDCNRRPRRAIVRERSATLGSYTRSAARQRLRDYRLRTIRKGPDCIPAPQSQKTTMKENRFPPGWNEQRVREVLKHYEGQTDEEAVAEDEASFEDDPGTIMKVPTRLASGTPAYRQARLVKLGRITPHRQDIQKALNGSGLVSRLRHVDSMATAASRGSVMTSLDDRECSFGSTARP